MAVKSFKRPNWINRLVLSSLAKIQKPIDPIFMHTKLKALSIGTPQPVAFMESYGGAGIQRSFLFQLKR